MELKGHTIGFKGEYSATVLKADGTVKEFLNEEKTLRSGDIIKNLLLDNFFEGLLNPSVSLLASGVSIRCGSGSTPVAVNQNSLTNQLTLLSGSWPVLANSQVANPAATFDSVNDLVKGSRTYSFIFALGQIAGNISELGVNMLQNGAGTLIHSRALVVDNLGNPATISVTASEQLIINYTIKFEMSAADVITTVPILVNGVSEDITVTFRHHTLNGFNRYIDRGFRGNDISAGNSALTARFVQQSGSNFSPGPMVTRAQVGEGVETTFNFASTVGNLSGGISFMSMVWGAGDTSYFKVGFNPPLPKNADRTLSITIRQTFGRLP